MKYIYDSSSDAIRIGVADDNNESVVWIEIQYPTDTTTVFTPLTGGIPVWKQVHIQKSRKGRGWQLYTSREALFRILVKRYPQFFSKETL